VQGVCQTESNAPCSNQDIEILNPSTPRPAIGSVGDAQHRGDLGQEQQTGEWQQTEQRGQTGQAEGGIKGGFGAHAMDEDGLDKSKTEQVLETGCTQEVVGQGRSEEKEKEKEKRLRGKRRRNDGERESWAHGGGGEGRRDRVGGGVEKEKQVQVGRRAISDALHRSGARPSAIAALT
jgi:hypothetical protein